jgi:hypothetical protein
MTSFNNGAVKRALGILQTGLVRCSQSLAMLHLISRCYGADSPLGLPNRILNPTMGP